MILVIVDRLSLSKLATYEPVLGVPPVDRQSPKFLLQAAEERFRRMAENALREPGCGLPIEWSKYGVDEIAVARSLEIKLAFKVQSSASWGMLVH